MNDGMSEVLVHHACADKGDPIAATPRQLPHGITLGLPAEDYHAMDGMSSGGIKEILKSPSHFQQSRRSPKAPTEFMQFGTVLHCAVLEPNRLPQVVAVIPADAPRGRSNAAREWRDEFRAANAGKIIIEAEAWERIDTMARNVLATDTAAEFLVDGDVEPTLIWTEQGTLCRARLDFLHRDRTVVVDLKMARDASPEGFQRAVWNYRYDIQAAWYVDAVTATLDTMPAHYLWCAMEPTPPYAIAWYRAEPDVIECGRRDCMRGMELYRKCLARNDWPGYDRRIRPMSLPRWARSIDAGNYMDDDNDA